jgi:pimeloyl-ACP methyl ester carboxylesterase
MGSDVMPHTGTVPANGVALSYRDWGGPTEGGAVPLVLLHGLASSAWIWDLVAPRLAQDRRVVALDQRGHGASDKPDTGYDFATIVADDLAAIAQLGLGPRVAVAGHSWGANVALEFGAAHPDRTAGLILVDGGFGMLRQRPGATWEQISRDLAPPNYAGTPRETFLGWIHQAIPNAGPAIDEIELHIVELRQDDTVGPRLVLANHMQILRAMWDEDPVAIYAAIQAPALFILAQPKGAVTEGDGFFAAKQQGIAQARAQMTHAPHVEVIWLPDTVHDIPLQRPAELAELMVAFLSGV